VEQNRPVGNEIWRGKRKLRLSERGGFVFAHPARIGWNPAIFLLNFSHPVALLTSFDLTKKAPVRHFLWGIGVFAGGLPVMGLLWLAFAFDSPGASPSHRLPKDEPFLCRLWFSGTLLTINVWNRAALKEAEPGLVHELRVYIAKKRGSTPYYAITLFASPLLFGLLSMLITPLVRRYLKTGSNDPGQCPVVR